MSAIQLLSCGSGKTQLLGISSSCHTYLLKLRIVSFVLSPSCLIVYSYTILSWTHIIKTFIIFLFLHPQAVDILLAWIDLLIPNLETMLYCVVHLHSLFLGSNLPISLTVHLNFLTVGRLCFYSTSYYYIFSDLVLPLDTSFLFPYVQSSLPFHLLNHLRFFSFYRFVYVFFLFWWHRFLFFSVMLIIISILALFLWLIIFQQSWLNWFLFSLDFFLGKN